MSIAPSGAVSSDDLLTELRRANPNRNYPLSLADPDVLALAGKSGAPVSMPADFYGKSAGSASPLAASMFDVEGSAISGNANAYVADVAISISVSGGQAPYSFVWSKLSGTGSVTAANAPTTTARFNVQRNAQPGLSYSEVAQCIVTDALGASATCTANVTLTVD